MFRNTGPSFPQHILFFKNDFFSMLHFQCQGKQEASSSHHTRSSLATDCAEKSCKGRGEKERERLLRWSRLSLSLSLLLLLFLFLPPSLPLVSLSPFGSGPRKNTSSSQPRSSCSSTAAPNQSLFEQQKRALTANGESADSRPPLERERE